MSKSLNKLILTNYLKSIIENACFVIIIFDIVHQKTVLQFINYSSILKNLLF